MIEFINSIQCPDIICVHKRKRVADEVCALIGQAKVLIKYDLVEACDDNGFDKVNWLVVRNAEPYNVYEFQTKAEAVSFCRIACPEWK